MGAPTGEHMLVDAQELEGRLLPHTCCLPSLSEISAHEASHVTTSKPKSGVNLLETSSSIEGSQKGRRQVESESKKQGTQIARSNRASGRFAGLLTSSRVYVSS
jgi:hypothetical protein